MIDQELKHSAFHASSDSLLITDSSYRILHCNRHAESLFSPHVTPLAGSSLSEFRFFEPDGGEIALAALVNFPAPIVCHLLSPTGSRLMVMLKVNSYEGSNEKNFLFSIQEIDTRMHESEHEQSDKTVFRSNQEILKVQGSDCRGAELCESETSNNFQQHIFFDSLPNNIPGVALSCFREGAEQGSGFFAFNRLAEDCFEILAGDVLASGTKAALVSETFKASYRRLVTDLPGDGSHTPLSPEKLINALHDDMLPTLVELRIVVTL